MALKTNHEATFWRFPLETVSGSEAGFERTYQGSCLLLQWLLKLPPGESVDIELEWTYRGNAVILDFRFWILNSEIHGRG